MKWFARFVLRCLGWTFHWDVPKEKKYVYLAFPHSSNWDGFYLLLFIAAYPVKLHWMGKKSLMDPPLGWITRPFGGVGIDRSAPQNMVEQMASVFNQNESFALAIPPEGTRSYRDYWKSGFYHIARTANVPVCCGVLDYKKKTAGFGPMIHLTGDIDADMDKIREIYREFAPEGLRPKKVGPIRVRQEKSSEDDN